MHNKINHITGVNLPEEDGKNTLAKGVQLIATFKSKWDYELCGRKIDIYTSNFVFNAIVDRVYAEEDGNTKVYFTDTKDEPMYISAKGFLSDEEADHEMKKAFDEIDEYKNAKTIFEHIQYFQGRL